MKAVYIFVTSICYLYASAAIDCPVGWIGHGTSCYHISHDTEPWMLAQMVCQGLEGYVVEIGTPQEDHFLINELKQFKGAYYWIGGDDLSVEGEWQWWRSKEDISYTNWLPSEPSNGRGNENCLSLKRISNGSLGWNDMACVTPANYICEKEAGQTGIVG